MNFAAALFLHGCCCNFAVNWCHFSGFARLNSVGFCGFSAALFAVFYCCNSSDFCNFSAAVSCCALFAVFAEFRQILCCWSSEFLTRFGLLTGG